MSDLSKQSLVEFMAARFFCTISTVGENMRPEAAYVAYASTNDHQAVIGTSNQSRKFKNISQNKHIALVIADMEGEVQYEGDVEVISSEEYESLFTAGQLPKLGGFDKYRSDPTQMYLKIKPTWIRFIVHGDVDQITEFTEFV